MHVFGMQMDWSCMHDAAVHTAQRVRTYVVRGAHHGWRARGIDGDGRSSAGDQERTQTLHLICGMARLDRGAGRIDICGANCC